MNQDRINLTHGSGGRAMAHLIEELFVKAFDNEPLRQRNDQASFSVPPGRLAMSTDGYVISPVFFPGGDIGSLAINGTINDVCMAGATPLVISAGFILEEGFLISDLGRIVRSMAETSHEAGVPVVTGDTKVVERGKGDGVFITTTGIGVVPDGVVISGDRARPGDRILVSGTIGDHGTAVMTTRNKLSFGTDFRSDCAALHRLVERMLDADRTGIHCMRDPTRGGIATTLNEIAAQSSVGMLIREQEIPIRTEVKSACEFLGLDPLYVANEGKLVAICSPESAPAVLDAMRSHPLGRAAALIGEVRDDPNRFVQMETAFGGRRIVQWLVGEQLPRIC